MSDHLRRVNLRDEALAGIDHVAPVHVARDANDDARELITALRAEREAHQATRAELEAAQRVIEAVNIHDPLFWGAKPLKEALHAYDAARAGQVREKGTE